jgi:hypothetical protein
MRFVPEFIDAQRQADAAASQPPAGSFEERLDERMRTDSIAWAKANLMVCAIWGGIRLVRADWSYAICAVPACYLTLLHMVFVSSIRYREPAMLPLIVLAAGAFYEPRSASIHGTGTQAKPKNDVHNPAIRPEPKDDEREVTS